MAGCKFLQYDAANMHVAESRFIDTANVVFNDDYSWQWHAVKIAAFAEDATNGLAEGLTGHGVGTYAFDSCLNGARR